VFQPATVTGAAAVAPVTIAIAAAAKTVKAVASVEPKFSIAVK